MPFEPEWLYPHELLALLRPSPDIAHVEAVFRRAVGEGRLRDRNGTPAEVWHRRFEIEVVFDWDAGMMFIPWFDHRRHEWMTKPIRPQFRGADWLAASDI